MTRKRDCVSLLRIKSTRVRLRHWARTNTSPSIQHDSSNCAPNHSSTLHNGISLDVRFSLAKAHMMNHVHEDADFRVRNFYGSYLYSVRRARGSPDDLPRSSAPPYYSVTSASPSRSMPEVQDIATNTMDTSSRLVALVALRATL